MNNNSGKNSEHKITTRQIIICLVGILFIISFVKYLYVETEIRELEVAVNKRTEVSYNELQKIAKDSDTAEVTLDEANNLICLQVDKNEYVAKCTCTDEFEAFLNSVQYNTVYYEIFTQDMIDNMHQANKLIDWNIIGVVGYIGFILFTGSILIRAITQTTGGLKAINKVDEYTVLGTEQLKDADEVAGLNSIVSDIDNLVGMLKNKNKLQELGVKCPKGILLVGPPGVGKTLIAKHIAKEAGLPFISCSGSDFNEVYVGLGAKRIRALFKQARSMYPGCVIFIDEVDSLAPNRKYSHNEDSRTLNALLKEMDGVESTTNVLVIAATNLDAKLDSAFTRPGRFNRTIQILPPQTKEDRDAIINAHIKGKKLSEDFDKEYLSEITRGMSGAEISNIITNAVTESVLDNREGIITNKDIEVSLDKILLKGNPQECTDENSNWRVSVHEAGHAIVALLAGKDVLKVTRIGTTSGVGGVTYSVSSEEMKLKTKKDLELEIQELYGGIVAETLLLGEPSVGASNDIERATQLVKTLVGTCGLSGVYLNMGQLDEKQFTEMCLKEAERLKVCAETTIQQNRETLYNLAKDIMENKTVYKVNKKYTISAGNTANVLL